MNVERISHNNSVWLVYRMLAEDYFDIIENNDKLDEARVKKLYNEQNRIHKRILERIASDGK